MKLNYIYIILKQVVVAKRLQLCLQLSVSHQLLTPRIIQPKNCTPNPAWMQMCFPPSRVEPTNEFPEIYVSKIIYDKFIETYYCSTIYVSHETYIGIYF